MQKLKEYTGFSPNLNTQLVNNLKALTQKYAKTYTQNNPNNYKIIYARALGTVAANTNNGVLNATLAPNVLAGQVRNIVKNKAAALQIQTTTTQQSQSANNQAPQTVAQNNQQQGQAVNQANTQAQPTNNQTQQPAAQNTQEPQIKITDHIREITPQNIRNIDALIQNTLIKNKANLNNILNLESSPYKDQNRTISVKISSNLKESLKEATQKIKNSPITEIEVNVQISEAKGKETDKTKELKQRLKDLSKKKESLEEKPLKEAYAYLIDLCESEIRLTEEEQQDNTAQLDVKSMESILDNVRTYLLNILGKKPRIQDTIDLTQTVLQDKEYKKIVQPRTVYYTLAFGKGEEIKAIDALNGKFTLKVQKTAIKVTSPKNLISRAAAGIGNTLLALNPSREDNYTF